MKKNNVLNYELNKYRERMNENAKKIADSIKDIECVQLNLLDTLIGIGLENERIINEKLDNSFRDFMLIEDYKKGEFIKISTNLVPPSMFTYEINNKYSNEIYSMKYALREKIWELNEKWSKVLIVYRFHQKYKKFDLENYYFKPFTDAIVESKIIEDDASQFVSILYKGYNSDEVKLQIELYNCDELPNQIKEILK